MALASAQIVDAYAERITGLPLAGARVYTARAWPIAKGHLPAWRVIAANEDIEPLTLAGDPLQRHELQVELRGLVAEVEQIDDAMHALAAEALTALFATAPQDPPDALDALAPKVRTTLRRIERHMGSEGEAAIGLVVITLLASFRTRASLPEAIN